MTRSCGPPRSPNASGWPARCTTCSRTRCPGWSSSSRAPGCWRFPTRRTNGCAATIDRAHQLAKSGLDEARRAIGMLRDDELPGPDQLAALARSFQADTGVACQYTEAGEPVDLRPAVRLALYRVTQEALTNVRKHAHPDRVEIRLEYLRDAVSLAVEDFAAVEDKPAPATGASQTSGGAATG